MTTTNSNRVVAGKPLATGGILAGPTSTIGPTDAAAALNVGFLALGYVGEDGLTETTDRSTDKVRAWGGDTVKVLQTDFSVTYAFTLLQATDTDVLKAVYGASNVTTTAATTTAGTLNSVKLNAATLPRQSFVFEVRDGNAKIRIYVPQGQITEVGDVVYNDSEVVGYAVTVEAFRDATLNANAVKFIDDAIASNGALL